MAAVCLTAFPSSAADVLQGFFNGRTNLLVPYTTGKTKTVSDGRLAVTVEQALVSKEQAIIVFSLQIYDNTKADWLSELMPYNLGVECKLKGGGTISSFNIFDIPDLDNFYIRHWAVVAAGVNNSQLEPMEFSLGIIDLPESERTIEIEAKAELETLQFKLSTEGCRVAVNPIGIRAILPLPADGLVPSSLNPGIYFRMSDGQIKSYNQLFSKCRTEGKVDASGQRYEIGAIPKEPMLLSDFKSVIVDGVEYDKYGSISEAEIPENLMRQTFTLSYCQYTQSRDDLDVADLFTRLGAKMSWGPNKRYFSVEYNGIEAKIYVGGKRVILGDGSHVDLAHSAHMINGRLMVDSGFIYRVIPLNVVVETEIGPGSEGEAFSLREVFAVYP